MVGANLEVMAADARRMRQPRPFIFSNVKSGEGVEQIAQFIVDRGGLHPSRVGVELVVEPAPRVLT
jgi:urease accessory protein